MRLANNAVYKPPGSNNNNMLIVLNYEKVFGALRVL